MILYGKPNNKVLAQKPVLVSSVNQQETSSIEAHESCMDFYRQQGEKKKIFDALEKDRKRFWENREQYYAGKKSILSNWKNNAIVDPTAIVSLGDWETVKTSLWQKECLEESPNTFEGDIKHGFCKCCSQITIIEESITCPFKQELIKRTHKPGRPKSKR